MITPWEELVFPSQAGGSFLYGVGAIARCPLEPGPSCFLPGPAHSRPMALSMTQFTISGGVSSVEPEPISCGFQEAARAKVGSRELGFGVTSVASNPDLCAGGDLENASPFILRASEQGWGRGFVGSNNPAGFNGFCGLLQAARGPVTTGPALLAPSPLALVSLVS